MWSSVCVNLAEAWRKRRYPAAFIAKLSDAEAEAEETRVHLEIAVACGYMDPDLAAELDADYDAILAGLNRMSRNPRAWIPRTAPGPPSRRGRGMEDNARGGGHADERLPPESGKPEDGR